MLSIRGVLGFFDGAVATERAHSNAINALLGEELGLGLLIHHLRASTGGDVAALADAVYPGHVRRRQAGPLGARGGAGRRDPLPGRGQELVRALARRAAHSRSRPTTRQLCDARHHYVEAVLG